MPPQSRVFYFEEEASVCSTHSAFSTRKRKIRFNLKENQTFEIPHIDDLDKEEIRDVWYQRGDYERMKTQFIPLIRKMMKGEAIEENDQQTIRGLEFRTRDGAIRRQHNKLEAITTVIEEQDRQRIENKLDDEQLREAYLACSSHCMDEACALGKRDEAEMKELLAAEQAKTKVSVKATTKVAAESAVSDAKKRGLSKLFKSVRTGAVMNDIKSLALARRAVVGQAA